MKNTMDEMPKEFREKLDSLPELNEYKIRVYNFMHLDKSGMSVEEVEKKYFEVSGGILPFILKEIDAAAANTLPVYRVRIVKEEGFFDNRLVRSFSYPDPSIMDKNGRANMKWTSVFYCADNWQTAIREMEPKVGDVMYLSKWTIKVDRPILLRPFFPHRSIPEESHMHKFSKNHFDEFQEWNRRNCKGKEEHIEYLHYMITEQFGFEKPPYNFSSWVANTLMYEHNGIDVLMYPSWKTQFMGCNFAFHPNFIDQYMTLDRVFQMTVKEFIIEKPGSESSIKWSHGKMGFVDRTNIHWKWPSEHEVSVLLNYVGGNYNVNISPTK